MSLNSSIHKRGFTLTELLIVVSVITVLITASLVGVAHVSKKARDARRLKDMEAIRNALELFYLDHGRYPDSTDGISDFGQFIGVNDTFCGKETGCSEGTSIDTLLAPYLDKIPKDPIHDGDKYYYAYDPNHFYNPETEFGVQGLYAPCGDSPSTNPDYPGDAAVIGFIPETNLNMLRGTCSGSHQGLGNGTDDMNYALVKP